MWLNREAMGLTPRSGYEWSMHAASSSVRARRHLCNLVRDQGQQTMQHVASYTSLPSGRNRPTVGQLSSGYRRRARSNQA